MKIQTRRDELLNLIPETEEERMLLSILSKRKVSIASHGSKDGKFSNLCLQFKDDEQKTNSTRVDKPKRAGQKLFSHIKIPSLP